MGRGLKRILPSSPAENLAFIKPLGECSFFPIRMWPISWAQDVTEDYSKSQRVNAFMKTLHSIPKDHDADAATREWMGYGHCKPWLILQGFIHKSDIDSLQAAVAACTHCHRRLGIGEGAPDQADPRLGQHLGGDVLGW